MRLCGSSSKTEACYRQLGRLLRPVSTAPPTPTPSTKHTKQLFAQPVTPRVPATLSCPAHTLQCGAVQVCMHCSNYSVQWCLECQARDGMVVIHVCAGGLARPFHAGTRGCGNLQTVQTNQRTPQPTVPCQLCPACTTILPASGRCPEHNQGAVSLCVLPGSLRGR